MSMAGNKNLKRKEPAQSSTLHDFFIASSAKKSRHGSTSQPTSRVATRLDVAPEGIIVISDDEELHEDEVQSRINLSDSSMMMVESEGVGPGTSLTPAGLAGATPQKIEEHSRFDPPMGEFILGEVRGEFTLEHISGTNHGSELPRYGDWEMGDDEYAYPEDEQDEQKEETARIGTEDFKIQLCEGEYSNTDKDCPVCKKPLMGFQTEVDRHVNSCIDSLPGSTSTVKAKEDKPLLAIQQPSSLASASTSTKSASIFSVLMSSHKENDAWKEASEAESKKGNFRGRRPAPFYKVMQGMPIAVDAFRYGKIPNVTAYFLTHAHSDHYTNLSSSWKNGPIYCSQATANLIIHMLNVDPKWVHPLPMDEATVIPDTGGVEVTLIQANHCPGSVLFLFKGMQTIDSGDSTFRSPFVGSQRIFRYLHCGDFRACPQHALHSAVRGQKIDTVYLDTTYLDPKYCFPPQPLVISACAELARRIVKGNGAPGQSTISENSAKDKGLMTGWVTISERNKDKENHSINPERVLVVVGTYTIGKERIVKAIARALSTKVYCDARKAAVLGCLSDPELHAMLTSDPFAAGVHIVPLHMITSDAFKDYLSRWKGHWSKAVGFRPTGWTYTTPSGMDTLPSISHVIARDQARSFTYSHLRPMRNSTPTLMLYGVPYSEHSSFFELTCFCLSLDWGKMIATVNVGSQRSRAKMSKWFEKWQAERNKRERSGEGGIVKYRQPDYW